MLTVVTGAPCSGKTTYVQQHAKPGDLVVDYDTLAVALGSPDSHDHPSAIAYVAKAVRQTAIRAALGCARKGARVWIIDTEPSPHRSQQYARAGARVITLTASREVLHERAKQRPDRWHTVIDEWLSRHAEQPTRNDLREW